MVGGEGDDQLGGVDVVPLQGAIVGGREGDGHFGGVDVVTLQGAIVVCYAMGVRLTTLGRWTWCHCWVLVCYGGGVTTRRSGRGAIAGPLLSAIAGCHCSVLWWGEGRVTANFGGVEVVPLQGNIVLCYG